MPADEAIGDLLRRLNAMPGRLHGAAGETSDGELASSRAPEEWSPAQILAHLRASDDILAPRFFAVLVRDQPPLPVYEERLWADAAGYTRLGFRASLETFTRRRAEFVAALQALDAQAWQRAGIHEVRGALPLRAMLESFVAHEEEHCLQIEASLAHPRSSPHGEGE